MITRACNLSKKHIQEKTLRDDLVLLRVLGRRVPEDMTKENLTMKEITSARRVDCWLKRGTVWYGSGSNEMGLGDGPGADCLGTSIIDSTDESKEGHNLAVSCPLDA